MRGFHIDVHLLFVNIWDFYTFFHFTGEAPFVDKILIHLMKLVISPHRNINVFL